MKKTFANSIAAAALALLTQEMAGCDAPRCASTAECNTGDTCIGANVVAGQKGFCGPNRCASDPAFAAKCTNGTTCLDVGADVPTCLPASAVQNPCSANNGGCTEGQLCTWKGGVGDPAVCVTAPSCTIANEDQTCTMTGFCTQSSVCATRLPKGTACTRDRACAVGLTCKDSVCSETTTQPTDKCQGVTCQAGQFCNSTNGMCEQVSFSNCESHVLTVPSGIRYDGSVGPLSGETLSTPGNTTVKAPSGVWAKMLAAGTVIKFCPPKKTTATQSGFSILANIQDSRRWLVEGVYKTGTVELDPDATQSNMDAALRTLLLGAIKKKDGTTDSNVELYASCSAMNGCNISVLLK